MFTAAHAIVYSKQPEADREFLRKVLGLAHVDAGGGWLIFGLPLGEIGVHPSEKNDVHEIFLTVDDVAAFAVRMKRKGVKCAAVSDRGWGLLTSVKLPGGGKLGVYEPRHARPDPAAAPKRKVARKQASRKTSVAKRTPKRKTARR